MAGPGELELHVSLIHRFSDFVNHDHTPPFFLLQSEGTWTP